MPLRIHAPHSDIGKVPDESASSSKALYRIPEAMRLLSLSRSMIYNQIRAGRLRTVKEGSSRLIPAEAISDYVALLKAEAEADR
jgi:excisionase family DNA binding protein